MSGGCRAAPRETSARIEPLERRIDHAPGGSLILPVSVEGPINPGQPPRVLLDDGRHVPAELHWVALLDDAMTGWLPSPGRWVAIPAAGDTRPPGTGSWCLVLAVPADAIGQGLWLGRRRLVLNWLADPPTGIPPGAPALSGGHAASLDRFLEHERASPLRRWRYRLLTRGLEPPAIPPVARDAPAPDEFESRALEALAVQTEARWRIALGRLARADPDLADRLTRRLLAVVDFGEVVAPAWPPADDQLDTLLADLLSPGLKDPERAERARAWLGDQPLAAGWIVDDAGTRDGATGRAVVTAGIANLADRATLGWAETEPKGASPDLVPVEPLTARRVAVVAPAGPDVPATRPRRTGSVVSLHLGRWSTRHHAATDLLPVRPPGFRLEPFFKDWTLQTWLSGSFADLAILDGPPDWRTSALLLREDTSQDQAERWTLYLECRTPPTNAAPREEVVRVWIGPFERARHVIRVTSFGDATEHGAAGATPGETVLGVEVTRRDDRWICRLPLPAGAIDADGTLRLAVDRTDARGVRSTWPRPMLPWQSEPGRIALDTRAWGVVGTAASGR